MVKRHRLVAASFSIMFLLVSGFSIPYQSFADNDEEKLKGRYIVVLKDDQSIDPQAEADNAKSNGAEILHVYNHAIKGFAITVTNEQALEGIKKNPNVSYVEQDQIVQAFVQTVPTGINRMDADLSSTLSGDGTGSVSVDIAVIDTGIDLTHPDLRVWNQVTYVWFTSNANDDNGHGTHVAGTAAAYDNSAGVVGVAPGARLWAVKVLDYSGSGYLSWIISGIDYVTAHASEIEVANMSLGFQGSTSAGDQAINNSVAAGVTYVVAAGNSSTDASSFWPAKNPNVITVSAIADGDGKCGGLGFNTSYGADDTLATFSNYGSVVDIAAPGVQIWSTYLNGGYNTLSGTSMASPHVAGAAALYKANNPGATPAAVKTALINSGVPQNSSCNTSQNNGYGGFSGDPDSSHEPLVYVGTVAPPPPVPPDPTLSMHIDDIAMTGQLSKKGKNNFCQASATVLLHDQDHNPLSGVSVTGQWSGAYSALLSASTGSNGKVTFSSSSVKGCGSFTFTVNDAVKSGFTYDSSSNVETSDSITLP